MGGFVNNYSLIYKHRRARLGVGAGLIHPFQEGDPTALGASPGSGERARGAGSGCSRRRRGSAVRGSSEERAGLAATRTTGFHPQTAAAPEPRCLPKKLLCKTPLAPVGAYRNHAWAVFFSFPSGLGSPWAPTAPGCGNDGAIFALHITQPLKPSNRKASGGEIRN